MANVVNVCKLNVERANEELASSRRGAIYRAVEQLGQGRRGNVFLCDNLDENDGLPARVALRFLARQASNASSDSLNSEISTHWLLNHHPHVLSFYTILLTRSFIVIVMEYAPGGTLASYITSLITHTSIQTSRHHRSSHGQPSTHSSMHTATNTHTDASSDHSRSGRHSHNAERYVPERKRMAIVRSLFQQLITLLEYVQLCGIALGEFQPECFMVSFDNSKEGGTPVPSLRLSHFGHLHSEHPMQEERTRTPTAQSDPDGPFCAVDLLHWTQTHPKPNLAPPPTLDHTRDTACHQNTSRGRHTDPKSPGACSASTGSRHSSQSARSRSSSFRSLEREREKSASRLLDVASAGSVLFYMLHGVEPFPADGEEMIKSWRSKDASGIAWPSHSSARTAAGELISWMLQPVAERCTLEGVKEDAFFSENLRKHMLMMTNNACTEELSTQERGNFMTDIRDIVYVSRKPSLR